MVPGTHGAHCGVGVLGQSPAGPQPGGLSNRADQWHQPHRKGTEAGVGSTTVWHKVGDKDLVLLSAVF